MGLSAVQLAGASAGGFEFLLLAVALACSLAWQYHSNKDAARLSRRVGRHAQSIANMDDWADLVDTRLSLLETDRLAANLNEADAGPAQKWAGLSLSSPVECTPAQARNALATDKAKPLLDPRKPATQQPAARYGVQRSN